MAIVFTVVPNYV